MQYCLYCSDFVLDDVGVVFDAEEGGGENKELSDEDKHATVDFSLGWKVNTHGGKDQSCHETGKG